MPSESPPRRRDDEEVRSFDAWDRVNWRVGRALAVGIPTWWLLIGVFALANLVPEASFILASFLATVAMVIADRVMVRSAAARRVLPRFGIAAFVAEVVAYSVYVAVWAGS
jgi:hypothetical protein